MVIKQEDLLLQNNLIFPFYAAINKENEMSCIIFLLIENASNTIIIVEYRKLIVNNSSACQEKECEMKLYVKSTGIG